MEARTDTKTVEEHYLLDCCHDLLSYLSYVAKILLPRDCTSHQGLGHSISSSNQETVFTDMPTGQSNEDYSPIEISFSQGCLDCYQVDKTMIGTDLFSKRG